MDIALQLMGSIEGLLQLMRTHHIAATACVEGITFSTTKVINQKVVDYYAIHNINPATLSEEYDQNQDDDDYGEIIDQDTIGQIQEDEISHF